MTVKTHANLWVHPSAVIGNPPEDRTWIREDGLHYPRIHPEARINAFVSVDSGTSRPTTVGAGTWLLKHAHVGHDAIVGDDCDIATGAIIGGWAEIGDRVKVGLNAVVLPFRKVGHGATIGAGSVVTKNVPAGETWAGNPARPVKRNPIPFTER